MREIKFRVYDQTSKDYTVYGIGEVVDEHFGLGIISRIVWWLKGIKHKFIIEQYTGLKDKNGREIYEGNIVKASWRRANHAKLDTKGEIKFSDGWFYIDDDPDGQDRLGVPIHNCYNVEVIGNIHENPELLGGKDE